VQAIEEEAETKPACFSLLKKSLEGNISNWKKCKPQPASASSCAGAAQRGRERGQKAHDFIPPGEFAITQKHTLQGS
jgi:hypothetical protein